MTSLCVTSTEDFPTSTTTYTISPPPQATLSNKDSTTKIIVKKKDINIFAERKKLGALPPTLRAENRDPREKKYPKKAGKNCNEK